jgi:hypothetical protein
MGDITLDNKSALLLQISDDLTIGLLDIDTCVLGHFGGESTSLVNGTRRNLVFGDDLVSETDSVIILSPSGCLVNDTSTSLLGDIVVRQDSESSILVLSISFVQHKQTQTADLLSEVVKHRDISPSDHIFSLETADLFEFRFFLGVWLLSSGVLLVDGTE